MDTYDIYLNAKETLIEKVKNVMLLEASKSCGQMNTRLIDECADLIMRLERRKDLPQEVIKEKIKILLPEQSGNNKKVGTRKLIKTILVAALIAAMLLSTSYYVYSSYGDEVLFAFESLGGLKNALPGDSIDYGDKEYIKGGEETAFYETIDEFTSKEPKGLLYPTVLPDGFSVTHISKRYDLNGYIEYLFATNATEKLSMTICENMDLSKIMPPDAEFSFIVNGFNCFIVSDEIMSQAVFIHNNMRYVVRSQTYDDVLLIINGLKEIE